MIYTAVQGQVADKRKQLGATVGHMLGMVGRARYQVSRGAHGHKIVIAGITITLDPAAASFERQLERLASAIEATIAYERASAMLAAAVAQTEPVPLWLVTGSSVLAKWLAWSRGEAALRRVLALSDKADIAPIAGSLERTARIALGHTAAKIRVSNGLAVADKIDLPAQRRCVLALGRTARVAFTGGRLPEAMVAALPGRSMAELSSHPFFKAAHFVIDAARNEEQSLVVDLEHDWQPLAPLPEAALAAIPADADPGCPWQPTQREVAELYGLVDELREHGRSA